MTMREKFLCNGVIHAASVAAGAIGAGLAQIPCSDNALITPLQLTMTVSLGKISDCIWMKVLRKQRWQVRQLVQLEEQRLRYWLAGCLW